MSNLKNRVQLIQQQLAVSNAETIARFKEVRADFHDALAELEVKIDHGFSKLQKALTDQGESHHQAVNDVLGLLVSHTEEQDAKTTAKFAELEARVKRLEEGRSPAA